MAVHYQWYTGNIDQTYISTKLAYIIVFFHTCEKQGNANSINARHNFGLYLRDIDKSRPLHNHSYRWYKGVTSDIIMKKCTPELIYQHLDYGLLYRNFFLYRNTGITICPFLNTYMYVRINDISCLNQFILTGFSD